MPSAPYYAIDPEEGPLHNLYYFIQDLESVVEERLDGESAAAVSIVEALREYAHKSLDSARDFAPTAQIVTLEILDHHLPVAEKERAKVLANPIAQEALELALLRETPERIQTTISRLEEMIGVVREFRQYGLAATYAKELAGLYLDGRDLAVYILARSAMEETLEGVIESQFDNGNYLDFCRTYYGGNAERPSLKTLIDFTFRKGVFPAKLKDDAHCIRLLGNYAVHDLPAFYERSHEMTVHQTVKTISALLKAITAYAAR